MAANLSPESFSRASADAEIRHVEQLYELQLKNAERLARKKMDELQAFVEAERKANKDTVLLQKEANEDWQDSYLAQIRRRQEAEREAAKRLQAEANNSLLAMGLTMDQIMKPLDQRKKELERAQQAALAAANGDADKEAEIRAEFAARLAEEQRLEKEKEKIQAKTAKKAHAQRLKEAQEVASAHFKTPLSLLTNKNEAIEDLVSKGMEVDEAKALVKQGQVEAAKAMIYNFADQLAAQGATIAKNQAAIDTRLQGNTQYGTGGMFQWRDIDWKIGKAVGVSPYVKQENVIQNLQGLVGQGIAFNVDQRAFLQTISEKIATTFNVADSSLVKLVRIQQADTSAARLGMESALTAFLNNMYSTTEYMTEAASQIRASIYEASALMGAAEATAFEYQVQKWMGSLHSVGFSNAEGLAGAFGKLAAGDISGITQGGYGNLLVMAANAAGLSVAQILEKGIDESDTNKLFTAMVDYLSKIYSETSESRVVAQQYANVFGLTASDLKAAANLSSSLGVVSKNSLNYSGMMGRLNSMANSMVLRTSMNEMMENLMGNFTYTMAASMGNNPVLYLTHNIAKMLKDTTGGINIPFINAMGFGVDLNATVADLMEVAAVSGSVLGGIGKLIGSLGGGGGFVGSGMLKTLGIGDGLSTITRGTGIGLNTKSGATVSQSGFVGNESASDIKSKTLQDASQEPNEQLAAAKEEAADIKLEQVDEHIVEIYDLLLDIVSGAKSFNVKLRVGDLPSAWDQYGIR